MTALASLFQQAHSLLLKKPPGILQLRWYSDAEPATHVVFGVSSDDAGAATVTPAVLTFTSVNWNTPQALTITGIADDDLADETPTVTVTVTDGSSDDNFDPLADLTVNVTVADNDSAGFTVSSATSTITEGGAADSAITVVLDAQPATDVVFGVASDDTGAATVTPATLTFTNANWNTPQALTITPIDDVDTVDETPVITITVTDLSSDDDFDPLADQSIAVAVTDDDTANVSGGVYTDYHNGGI